MSIASAALCSYCSNFLGRRSLWCLERKHEKNGIFSALRNAVGWLGELCMIASNSEQLACKAICLVQGHKYWDEWLDRALPLNQSVLAKDASAL